MADQQSMLTTFLYTIFVSILTHTKMPNLDVLYNDRQHHGITKECFFFLLTQISATEQNGKLYCLHYPDLFVLLHHQMTAQFLR